MSNQIVITSGAKVRELNDVIIGTSGVLSSLAFNVANGVPKLDSNAKILVSQLPNSVMEYQGTWNAATNTPTLTNGGAFNQGDVYLCNVAGTTNFGAGPISFIVGDSAIYSGSIWQRSGGATGSVTSVGLSTDGNAITIGNSPITTSGTITANFAGTSGQYINGAGNLTTFPTLLSSVGLSMPSAFSVSNSPLTANGTIAVTGAGYPSQYIRGDGTLADFPSSGGGGSSVSYYLNGGTSQGTIGGVTYYEMSKIADTGTGVDFPKTGDGLIVSFLTDAGDPAQLNIPAGNWNYEIYASMSANGGTPEMYAELYKYDGTTFTLISTSSNEILYDGTNLNLYTFAMTVPSTTLAITDRLAVKLYATNSGGKTTTVHTQDSHLCQVITTFSTGITALNGLTAQIQYFATGTSGTDFAISSSTATHTFNLPVASASNTGKLSSTDWSTFNNKQATITLTTTGTSGAATFVSNTLNIPNYGSALSGYVTLDTTQTITGLKTFSNATLFTANNLFTTYPNRFTEGVGIKETAAYGVTNGYTTISGAVNGLSLYLSNGGIKTFLFSSSTSNNTYTFPDATGTIALTSDIPSLTGYVTLGTTQTITGQKTFSLDILVNNLTIGKGSGTGTLNTAIGQYALFVNTTGYGNTSVGHNALGYNTTGFFNAAIGVNALLSNTIGTYNNALGTASLYNNTTGSNNTAVGQQAGTNNTTGSNNTYIGSASGSSITTGSNNTIIGAYAGTFTMANNIVLADGAGNVRYRFDGTNNIFANNVNFSSTIGNGTYTYTLPSATGTLALVGGSGVGTVTSVAALTLGTTGTDLSSTVANSTTTPVITLNVPTASATNRGALSSADWTTFNNKQNALTNPVTGTGTTNTHAKFTSTSVIGNSMVSDDGTTLTSAGATRSNLYIKAVNNSYYGQLAFTNGTNASTGGISYNNASQYMQFETSTSEWMRLTSDGKLGIGTTSPAYTLDVSGTLRNTTSAYFATTSGSVGIGTTSPAYPLDVKVATNRHWAISASSTGFASFRAGDDGYNNFNRGEIDALPLLLNSQSGGNVGIGTSSTGFNPAGLPLVVGSGSGNTGLTIFSGTSSSGSIHFADTETTGGGSFSGYINYDHSGNSMQFGTNSTERMRIGSTASQWDLIIGATSVLQPSTGRASVTINGSANSIVSFGVGGALKGYLYHGGTQMYIENSISGGALYVNSGGSGGVYLASGGTAWISSSDERLKNINSNIENAVDKLSTLRTVNFSWKSDSTNKEILGLIAQDVEAVFPQVIDKNKLNNGVNEQTDHTEYLGIRYTELIPVLVKAIQEMNTKLDEQNQTIQNLQEQINILSK